MAEALRFNFVCLRTFSELRGESDRIRHCDDCDLDVHNFDAMSEWERAVMMKDAAASDRRLCISVTERAPQDQWCLGSDLGPPLLGEVCTDHEFESLPPIGDPKE